MAYTFDELRTAVDKCLPRPETLKDNLFDIGTRGFYENPFTEVFAYLISAKSHYKHSIDFTKSFLESISILPNEVIQSFLLEINVLVQQTTIQGNYIDFLIYNSKYILVFENKIGHWLANPVADYENDIKSRYTHLIPYFFVLSYNPVQTPEPWINVVIKDSFASIKSNLSVEIKDKWDFFVEDFLNHYISVTLKPMTEDEFKFYESNFSKITAANNQVNQFITGVAEKVSALFPIGTINRTISHSEWAKEDTSRAVRLFPFDTSDNVVLIFQSDGRFSIAIYYYQDPRIHLSKLYEFVGPNNYRSWKEGSVSCFARLNNKAFDTVEELVDESANQLTIMMKYLTKTL